WQLSGVTQALTGIPFTPTFNIAGASTLNVTGNILGGSPGFGGSNSNNPFNNFTSNFPYEGARIGYVKGCDPYTHSSDPFNRLNAACFFAPSPGSICAESSLHRAPPAGAIASDMSV